MTVVTMLVPNVRSLRSPPHFFQMGCFKTTLSSHVTAEETGFQRSKGLPGSQVRGTAQNTLCSRRLRFRGLEQPLPLLHSPKAPGRSGLHGPSGNPSSSIQRQRVKAELQGPSTGKSTQIPLNFNLMLAVITICCF